MNLCSVLLMYFWFTVWFNLFVFRLFWGGGWRYLTRRLIWHLSQSSIRPSIYFSSIVKSLSNPFLEPTSTKQQVSCARKQHWSCFVLDQIWMVFIAHQSYYRVVLIADLYCSWNPSRFHTMAYKITAHNELCICNYSRHGQPWYTTL